MTWTIGSLFSGVGGLELGLESAGLGPTVWQAESDPYCLTVLARHWPAATRFDDVHNVRTNTASRVDVICGGFPCQDISSAGKRAGLSGDRSGLWFEFERVVRDLRPQWVVVENVASGARAWVDRVMHGLGLLGYACLPIPLAAADVGAPHERRRIFIVAAHVDAVRQHARAEYAETRATQTHAANAVSQRIRHESRRGGGSDGADPSIAAHASWCGAQPDMVRMVHGFPARMDSRRVKALGNAVLPQCAAVIGHVIRELAE